MRYRRLHKIICIFVFACFGSSLFAQSQETGPTAVLVVAPLGHVAKIDETITLDIILRNDSAEPFYTCGTLSISLLRAICTYRLEVRPFGAQRFERIGGVSGDPLDRPYSAPLVPDRFRSQENLVLLHPHQFLGLRIAGTWMDITTRSPGKYEVRVVYSTAGRLPVALDRPYLLRTVASNVIQMEVLP